MKSNSIKKAIYTLLVASVLSVNVKGNKNPVFIENKGQVHDQNSNLRPDVLFSGYTGGLTYHLKNNGLSYQLVKVDSWNNTRNSKTGLEQKTPEKLSIYRVDIEWLNANQSSSVEKGEALGDVNNYYSESCPNGILDVHSYKEMRYKDIYEKTDLKWYSKNSELEYDFVLYPGANVNDIKLKIAGASSVRINSKGELEIETPFGVITEKAPVAYQNSKTIKANWKLNGNVASFELGEYDLNSIVVIDPSIRVWGTYYGGASTDDSNETCLDNSGNVYIVGATASNAAIATSGAHQTTISTTNDAFICKFNSSGTRLWATYYGGTGTEAANACTTDATGNVYVVGNTTTTNSVLATAGAYQVFPYGGADGFVAKFNASGVRQWGTYYSDIGADYLNDIGIDNAANVYIVGASGGSFSLTISTAGSHQVNNGGGTSDAFLVKFNTSGTRQWGTFYGGTGSDAGLGCFVESGGGVFITGNTASNTGTIIATAGAHQPAHGGGTNDAFLAYFNTSGVRQWGTYYGATGNDFGTCVTKDGAGFVYMGGYASSGSAIATVGAHQTSHGGGTNDGILVKFNSSGVRQWGTYYGGPNNDYVMGVATNTVNNKVYITGNSNSGSNIATNNAYQTVYGGGLNDAFLVSFISNGVRQIGTFYGGTGNYDDQGTGCVTDVNGNLYMTGKTTSPTVLATVGAHQTTFGGFGMNDGFLVKFQDCSSTFSTALTSTTVCDGQSVNLTTAATGVTSYSWSNGATTSSISISPSVTTNYTVTANTATAQCFYTKIMTVSVTPSPTLNISGTNTICSGATTTLSVTGANTYSWSTSATTTNVIVSPTLTTTYSVTGTNTTTGCSSTATRTVTVNATPSVTLAASSPSICSGSVVTLTATGATTYSWSTSQTTSTIIVTPNLTTTYTVTGTSLGCTNTKTVTINVTATPTVNTTASSNPICTGNTVTITASSAATYSWSTGATTNSIAVSPSVTTNYTVIGTNGSCSTTRTLTIFNSTPILNVSATSTAICIGGSTTLTASGATSYSWNTSATTSVISVSPASNTTYTVIGTTGVCTSTTTIAVNVGSAIVINAIPSASISCSGSPVIITASGASTYTWSTGPNTTTISVAPTISTNYTVSGTSGSCSGSTVITIGVSTNPTVSSITSSSLICSLPVQQSATLTASGATTYSWNTGATTAAITVSPGISTTYTVTGYNAQGCFDTSVITQSVSACTGINETIHENNVLVYPNPSNGEFTIKGFEGKIEIVNSIGQTVYSSEINTDELKVSGLSAGIYYLRIENSKLNKKIVVVN